jgi:hypothetical protein
MIAAAINVNPRWFFALGPRGRAGPPPRLQLWLGRKRRVPPGSGLVEIDLIGRDGGTLLRMTHGGLPNAAQCAGHDKGWAHYLGRLAMAAAGRNPGIDRGPVLRDA